MSSSFMIDENGVLICLLGCKGDCVTRQTNPEAQRRAVKCGDIYTTIPFPSGVLVSKTP